jgi:hypothetical protein
MSSTELDIYGVVARLNRLEGQNRRLRIVVTFLIVLAGGAGLLGAAAAQNRVVTAQEFRLVDDDGNVRGLLKVTDQNSAYPGAAHFELRGGGGKTFLQAFGYDGERGGTIYIEGKSGYYNITVNEADVTAEKYKK